MPPPPPTLPYHLNNITTTPHSFPVTENDLLTKEKMLLFRNNSSVTGIKEMSLTSARISNEICKSLTLCVILDAILRYFCNKRTIKFTLLSTNISNYYVRGY